MTHLQWSLEFTYCEMAILEKKAWRSRSGPVNCMNCIRAHGRARGGETPNQKAVEQLDLLDL